jgi:hypothetical protein
MWGGAVPQRERPLDPDDAFCEFAAGLRRVREHAGGPTYRELSRRAHYSAAALSEAASGRKLPSLDVTVAYVAACGGDVAGWKVRWQNAAAEVTSSTRSELDLAGGKAPYVGLRAFQIEDAESFFGREEVISDILALMRERRLVGVFGGSGSGKSSIFAGGRRGCRGRK